MEFRAHDHHHHDQMRATSATATSSLAFNHAHHQIQHQTSERRRSSSSSSLNGNNNSAPTPGLVVPAANPSSDCTEAKPKATPFPAPSMTSAVKYRECLKNHAASAGGSVFDGCGEFMPSGEDGSLEALKCAACQCHRNFHRKELDGADLYSPGSRRSTNNTALVLNPIHLTPPLSLHHRHKYPIVQPMNVAYGPGSGPGAESSSEELNPGYGDNVHHSAPASKKRFRTKFTPEQKGKMMAFAESVGWRFQKQDEDAVERFCADVGVKRQVLKVWMHNNKSSNVARTTQQLDHVSAMMGNLGTSLSSAAGVAPASQVEEGEIET